MKTGMLVILVILTLTLMVLQRFFSLTMLPNCLVSIQSLVAVWLFMLTLMISVKETMKLVSKMVMPEPVWHVESLDLPSDYMINESFNKSICEARNICMMLYEMHQIWHRNDVSQFFRDDFSIKFFILIVMK